MNFSRPVIGLLWRHFLIVQVSLRRDVEMLFGQMLRLHTPRVPQQRRDITEDLLVL